MTTWILFKHSISIYLSGVKVRVCANVFAAAHARELNSMHASSQANLVIKL